MEYQRPRSPRDEVEGMIYFPRLCDKARLHAAGKLHPEYHANLGAGSDGHTCKYLGVPYEELKAQILCGSSDEECLAWARRNGAARSEIELKWWSSFIRNQGFRDDLSEKLESRKAESGFQERADLMTFFDYIDADDTRIAEG